MRKNIAIVLLSAACVALAFVKLTPTVRIGFVGDSIVNGYGLKEKPGDIAALILTERTGVRVYAINCGVDRSSTADWIEGSANLTSANNRLEKARVVLVSLGANDAYNRVSREQYHANLESCLRSLGEDRTIAIHPPSVRSGGNMDAESAALLESYWCKPLAVVDLCSDGVHPTPEGNRKLGEIWAETILRRKN